MELLEKCFKTCWICIKDYKLQSSTRLTGMPKSIFKFYFDLPNVEKEETVSCTLIPKRQKVIIWTLIIGTPHPTPPHTNTEQKTLRSSGKILCSRVIGNVFFLNLVFPFTYINIKYLYPIK